VPPPPAIRIDNANQLYVLRVRAPSTAVGSSARV
jgi:hypothetical protein